MGTTEESLARTRVENRRASPEWRSADSAPGAGDGGSSLETAPHLAQATSGYDTAALHPGNRMKGLKRLAMRLLRFHTDRQVQFNRNVVQVLAGLSERIASLAGHDERARAAAAGFRETLADQGTQLRELRAQVEELYADLRVAAEDVGGSPASLEDVVRSRGLHSRRVGELYRQFEERFRGSPEMIQERVAVYVPRLVEAVSGLDGSLPVLDVGCGRGELLHALVEAGIRAEGVEANDGMADACEEAGLPVRRSDLFQDLRARPTASLAAITAIQVVEHLGPEALLRFLELARDKIVPGGLLVLETIDVRTLFALRWYYADPTHNLPLMPETLSFWVEAAGFSEIETQRLHPAEVPVETDDPRLARIMEVIFGPQDFSLIARRPTLEAVLRPEPAVSGERADRSPSS